MYELNEDLITNLPFIEDNILIINLNNITSYPSPDFFTRFSEALNKNININEICYLVENPNLIALYIQSIISQHLVNKLIKELEAVNKSNAEENKNLEDIFEEAFSNKALDKRKVEEDQDFDNIYTDIHDFVPNSLAANSEDTILSKINKYYVNYKNLNKRDDDYKNSLLHVAAFHGLIEVVKLLLEKKANIEAQNIHNETPLFMAILNGSWIAAEVLIENGANLSIPDNQHEKFIQNLLHKIENCENEKIKSQGRSVLDKILNLLTNNNLKNPISIETTNNAGESKTMITLDCTQEYTSEIFNKNKLVKRKRKIEETENIDIFPYAKKFKPNNIANFNLYFKASETFFNSSPSSRFLKSDYDKNGRLIILKPYKNDYFNSQNKSNIEEVKILTEINNTTTTTTTTTSTSNTLPYSNFGDDPGLTDSESDTVSCEEITNEALRSTSRTEPR